MSRAVLIFGSVMWIAGVGAICAGARGQEGATRPPEIAASHEAQFVDGVAVHVEDGILMESEVRELGEFQTLVEGRAKSRTDLIDELAEQWIVRGEAEVARFPQPSAEDVDHAYAQLSSQFASADEFRKRCAAAHLIEAAVRRMLTEQLYLSRFLDFRFRPAVQVDTRQVEAYYRDEFAPQLKARGAAVPPIEDVQETIREVLIQRAINERAMQWLKESRERLKMDVVRPEEHP
jgi:hypothetical protein